jgi:hypothetical protein
MPACIFCNRDVTHHIAPPPSERSICLDCLVELRRFELQHMTEIVPRTMPQRFLDAIRRLRALDASQLRDPAMQEQIRQDLQTVQQVIPF